MTTPEGVPADDKSISDLFDEIMGELRLLSALYMKTHPPEVTLQPTVIVSEAFIRLANHKPEDFKDEDDFRATASVILRQVFAERAKKRMEEKKRMAEQAEARKREAAAAAAAPAPASGKDSDLAEFQGASPELTLALENAFGARRPCRARRRTAHLRVAPDDRGGVDRRRHRGRGREGLALRQGLPAEAHPGQRREGLIRPLACGDARAPCGARRRAVP
jgi:hypothetical protein